ncbi:extensin-like domain-containing protein [Marimonas lutisalis]|uniref:extensin-like domain-containing protein n=1 Tax=Marimonas lutisalis TaxID=2545756 RepID=UPI0010F98F79|nr:extensin family protein [Marimonas lutisalis]
MKFNRLVSLVIFLGLSAGAAFANAPDRSLRPISRAVIPDVPPTPAQKTAEPERRGFLGLLRPKQRSERAQLFASKKQRELQRGMVCGDIAIQGEPVGRVPGRISGCGVKDAVRVRSVAGVGLSQQAVMDCTTAKALKSWVEKGMKPAVGNRGGGVARIKVAAHYACRTRNNQRGAKISEHGKGRAIDIASLTLKDGSEISVLQHWGQGWRGRALRAMHARACGPFGTVLGPDANRYHRDHFHFDTARYRSGSYCR